MDNDFKLDDRNVELIIFDMDGLMFDTEKVAFESWAKASYKFGYTLTKELFNTTIGINLKKTVEIFKDHFGEDFPADDIILERTKISDEIIDERGVPIKTGLFELLDFLKEKGYRMAVATSTSRKRASKLLTKAGIIDRFETMVCGDEVINSKPDPEVYVRVLNKLDVEAGHAMVLEDSMAGIAGAYAAGALPVIIPDILPPSEEIKAKLFRELKDLTEVIEVLQELNG